MRRLGDNDFGYVAEVKGRKMEFTTETDLNEYIEEPEEESNGSSIFSQNSHIL